MSEIRALLLTDVVDSTKLAESIGDTAMAQVWAAHDRIARDLLQRHRGREIDKTDGMLHAVRAGGRCRCLHDGIPPRTCRHGHTGDARAPEFMSAR